MRIASLASIPLFVIALSAALAVEVTSSPGPHDLSPSIPPQDGTAAGTTTEAMSYPQKRAVRAVGGAGVPLNHDERIAGLDGIINNPASSSTRKYVAEIVRSENLAIKAHAELQTGGSEAAVNTHLTSLRNLKPPKDFSRAGYNLASSEIRSQFGHPTTEIRGLVGILGDHSAHPIHVEFRTKYAFKPIKPVV